MTGGAVCFSEIFFKHWKNLSHFRIATATAKELSETGSPPVGLILESPFNNLLDVVTYHPFATPFRWLPWFNRTVLKPLHRSGLNMSSDYRITKLASSFFSSLTHYHVKKDLKSDLSKALFQIVKLFAKKLLNYCFNYLRIYSAFT